MWAEQPARGVLGQADGPQGRVRRRVHRCLRPGPGALERGCLGAGRFPSESLGSGRRLCWGFRPGPGSSRGGTTNEPLWFLFCARRKHGCFAVQSDQIPTCHPAISSSVVPFSSCPQAVPASESFPMSQLFARGGQSTGVSALASFLMQSTS